MCKKLGSDKMSLEAVPDKKIGMRRCLKSLVIRNLNK